jgi:hypothetical protein
MLDIPDMPALSPGAAGEYKKERLSPICSINPP